MRPSRGSTLGLRRHTRLLLLIGLLVLLSACAGSSRTAGGGQGSGQLAISWAEFYRDLGSLKRASALAVAGTIVAIDSQTVEDGIPFTDFRLRVSRLLYNPRHLLQGDGQGSELIIHQTGGLLNGEQVSVQDDPLFQIGEGTILFLRPFRPGHYLVVGGPSGRFRLHNGLVTSITDEGIRLNWPLTAEEFKAALDRA